MDSPDNKLVCPYCGIPMKPVLLGPLELDADGHTVKIFLECVVHKTCFKLELVVPDHVELEHIQNDMPEDKELLQLHESRRREPLSSSELKRMAQSLFDSPRYSKMSASDRNIITEILGKP